MSCPFWVHPRLWVADFGSENRDEDALLIEGWVGG